MFFVFPKKDFPCGNGLKILQNVALSFSYTKKWSSRIGGKAVIDFVTVAKVFDAEIFCKIHGSLEKNPRFSESFPIIFTAKFSLKSFISNADRSYDIFGKQ